MYTCSFFIVSSLKKEITDVEQLQKEFENSFSSNNENYILFNL